MLDWEVLLSRQHMKFEGKQLKVTKRKNLKDAVSAMIESTKPFFLEVCVEKEANVFPMIPTGASVSDIRLK